MSYTLQFPPAIVKDAKIYASSCGTSLSHLVKMYIIEHSTRKPEMKKRKMGIANVECRIHTEEEDRAMDEESVCMFGSASYAEASAARIAAENAACADRLADQDAVSVRNTANAAHWRLNRAGCW